MGRIVLEEPDWEEMERLYGPRDKAAWQREIAEATERGRIADETEPRAVAARFDAKTRRMEVALRDGCTFIFPVDVIQGLRGADPQALANVRVIGAGFGLAWDDINEDLWVPDLLARRYGTDRWMSQLAREMGRAKSPAKAAAARENGKKGGRPRKSAPK